MRAGVGRTVTWFGSVRSEVQILSPRPFWTIERMDCVFGTPCARRSVDGTPLVSQPARMASTAPLAVRLRLEKKALRF
jgi:hypothetical protein